MFFFLSNVYANDTVADVLDQQTSFSNLVGSVVPLLIFVAIFYFLILRPQQKKQQEHEKEVKGLKPNDKVITAGGIYGKVVKVKQDVLVIEISDGVEIEILPDSVNLIKEEVEKKTKSKK